VRTLVQPPPSTDCDPCGGELRLKLVEPANRTLDLENEIFVCANCDHRSIEEGMQRAGQPKAVLITLPPRFLARIAPSAKSESRSKDGHAQIQAPSNRIFATYHRQS
jgi:hypothetical protein